MPQISVIVPVYNVEPYLRRCVDSILAQTFTDFELILVDDGSPDGCPAICDEYAEKNSRVHVIHQQNGGLSAARNAGIDWAFANSDSEWITFIDSDDWVATNYCEALFHAAVQGNCKISSCRVKRMKEYVVSSPTEWSYSIENSEDVYTLFGDVAIAYACARLYDKQLFRKVRFPVGKIFEDVATIYKVLLPTENISYIPQKLYYYFFNMDGTALKNWSPQKMDIFVALEEQLEYLKKHPKFKKTYRTLKKGYLQGLSYAYFSIPNSDLSETDKKKYRIIVTRKARKAFILYHSTIKLSLQNDHAIFDAAFPKLMGVYWFYKSHFRGEN